MSSHTLLSTLVLVASGFMSTGDIPLNEWPMIISHDSATGYLPWTVVNDWAITQSGGLNNQLDCGTRSFDLRPHSKDGTLNLHHGDIIVDKLFADAVDEVVSWCSKNTTELVVIYLSHCSGDNDCTQAADAVLAERNITLLTSLTNVTYQSALELSALPSGGHLLAIGSGNVDESYDPSVKCYKDDKWCYGEGSDAIFNDFWAYMEKITQKTPSTDGSLRMVQAHWQEDTQSVIDGIFHLSSLLLDESRAKVVEKVTERILAGKFKHLNLVEVNNVCDGGNKLLDALRTTLKVRLSGQA